ncbi:MAG: hypothetical protein IPL28_09700, partial [Chloroflexi bacterium]|nr:hypothetical protein [Chloroflexota bacterium]
MDALAQLPSTANAEWLVTDATGQQVAEALALAQAPAVSLTWSQRWQIWWEGT